MENLTHSLMGLAVAKAGLERRSPYATSLCVLAANAPDADIVALLGGRFFYLEHHRGITHSIVGILALAFLLPCLFYGGERLLARIRATTPRARLPGLMIASLIATATHPLLDWTNNYGVRPLLPWSARWFYGDLVFIFDPYLWLILGGAAFLVTSGTRWRVVFWAALALVLTTGVLILRGNSGMSFPPAARVLWLAAVALLAALRLRRVGARWGAAIPATALALVVVYWGTLALLHARAVSSARSVAQRLVSEPGEGVLRLAAMPVLANPLRWRCVAETERASLLYEVSLVDENETNEAARAFRIEKPQGVARELAAEAAADPRAKVFLNFARFPVSEVQRGCAVDTVVQFADLRYTLPGRANSGGSFTVEIPVEPRQPE